ncbi:MAG TPA: tetratricopeptide repeat protein [Burkholderiales bacterium]|nr:tetratricopeptide repeat protein [Burkholderiales bacterium]
MLKEKRLRRFIAALIVLAVPIPVMAADALTREQALGALTAHDAAARRVAAERLGEVGTMADVPALVNDLRDDDSQVRGAAEDAIEAVWGRSGDAMVDALYRRGVEQMNDGDTDSALATFNLVISKKPDFAEGWNKRATVYYMIGDYEKSLHDCDEVLKRNPLHFGALSGYGLIYMQRDEPARALDYFRRALAINPNLEDVAGHIRALEHLIAERRERYI